MPEGAAILEASYSAISPYEAIFQLQALPLE